MIFFEATGFIVKTVGNSGFQMQAKYKYKDIGENGASLIELAIVLPVLFLLVAGMVDIGFKVGKVKTVATATRHAARIASSYSKNLASPPPCGEAIREVCPAGNTATTIAAGTLTEVARDAACNYLKSNGLSPEGWIVDVPLPNHVFEDGQEFSTTTVGLEPASDRCFICYQRVLSFFRPSSSSTFVLEGGCS